MPVRPEILIVADSRDELAYRLHDAVARRSQRSVFVDGPAAARLFTITVDEDRADVSPDIPVFIRASAWWGGAGESEDERFLRREARATLWAAAALCQSPVINRPTQRGSVGRLTVSGIASRAGSCEASTHGELYVSEPAMARGRLDPPIWGEDIDFRTREFSKLRPKVPARVRSVAPGACYEIVTIVGGRALAATEDPCTERSALLDRSIDIVDRLELQFATVTWMVSADAAVPVRVNAEPTVAELHTHMAAVLDWLYQDLSQ